MKQTKINSFIFDGRHAFSFFAIKIFASACLSIFFAFGASAQDLPDKIRGYRVYDAQVTVGTAFDKAAAKTKSAAQVRIGEPEIAEISLSGITFEFSAEIFGLEQSGTIDFLTFRDFRVNDLTVEIEDYKEPFAFKKNQPVKLPKPARISLGTGQAVRGAMRESKESKPEWTVTGKVFVFGRFKKFGLSFKRVVPVAVNVKIKNPLKDLNASSN